MKIIFIYPSLSDTGFNIEGGSILFNQMHRGLSCLSSVCKKAGFNDIGLIDLRLLRGWDEFRDKIRQEKPDIAGITMMSPDYEYASKCVDIIKEVSPRVKTVVGGMHPTVMTSEVADNMKIDHIVTGEGEKAFVELVKRVEKGEPADRIIRGELADVNGLPFDDREFFDFLEQPFDFFLPLPFATILAGRGCGYSCRFCSPAGKLMHGYRIRRRSVDNVIEELKRLRDTYGIKSVQFWDDCFTEDKGWVMEFCDKYAKEGFDQPFVCQTRADIISKNPDMMKRLKKAGLVMAAVGFESGNDRVLKFMNKGTTLKQNLRAARICKTLGVKIWAYIMFGVPTETNEEAADTVKMVKKIKPYRTSAAFFTPHPGSFFYQYCEKHGLSLVGQHDSFVRFPEVDKPKIKNIDYGFLKKEAIKAKKMPFRVKARIRMERVPAHKKRKTFLREFTKAVKENPGLNKMAVLRRLHKSRRA